ncbi:hypothetical protein K502DRAFT_348376 [Neoconidiobolus thromboides FSU 785]|nr:hypothetical protein K502DRAFT_348376 [Neoconidiobolus thromboides FSU 785]
MPYIPQSPLAPSGMTHSPNILGRLTAENLKASVSRIPNVLRLILRCIQGIASLTAFIFSLSANARGADLENPYKDLSSVKFLYFTSAASVATSIFFIIDYYRRRMQYKVKIKRVYLVGIDSVIVVFWLSDIISIFTQFRCAIGTLDGVIFLIQVYSSQFCPC